MYTTAAPNVQLPFDPTRATLQYYQFNPQSPPCVPAVQALIPEVMGMVPALSALCAMEIQTKSTTNPLRMFMFNRFGQNMFNNQDFAGLVDFAAGFLVLQLAKRVYPNAEMGAQDAVMKACEMLAAVGLAEFPGLQAFLNAQQAQGAQELINTFNFTRNELATLKQRMGGGGQMQMQAPQTNFGFNQGNAVNYGGSQPGWGQQWAPPTPMATPGNSNVSMFRGGQAAPAIPPGEKRPINTSRFDDVVIKQPFEARPVQQQSAPAPAPAPTAAAAAQETPVEEIPASKHKWSPSETYPYFVAYNPVTHELVFRQQVGGEWNPTLKKRKEPVDYNAHATPSVFGPRPHGLNMSETAKRLEEINRGIDALNNEEPTIEHVEGEEAPQIRTELTKSAWLAEVSEQSVWMLGQLERMKAHTPEGEVPDVYRCFAVVAEPLVDNVDETGYVKGFAQCASFLQLRDKLNEAVATVSAGLWAAVERRMTRTVNRLVMQNLGIPKVRIQSFASDIEELQGYLEKKFGKPVLEAFLEHQKDHIRRTLGVLDPSTAESLTSAVLDPDEYVTGDVPKITYLGSNYSFTFLNIRSHELQVELNKDSSSAVIESILPELHSLLKGVFGATKGADVDRHLIRTSDGRVLEASQGYLVEDFYVLTLIE